MIRCMLREDSGEALELSKTECNLSGAIGKTSVDSEAVMFRDNVAKLTGG